MSGAHRREPVTVVLVTREPVPGLSPALARVLLRILRRAIETRAEQENRNGEPPEVIAS